MEILHYQRNRKSGKRYKGRQANGHASTQRHKHIANLGMDMLRVNPREEQRRQKSKGGKEYSNRQNPISNILHKAFPQKT
jgi:hypothetical protein